MKTFVLVSAIAFAIISFAAAEECSATTLSFALLPLAPQAGKCATDSAYKLYPFKGMPSFDQLKDLCKSDTCQKLLDEAKDGDMPDCNVTVSGTGYNVKASIDLIVAGCEVVDLNSIAS